jgi:hypothetical protein
MSKDDKRLAALREYHARRIIVTRKKLYEALDRIKSKTTVVIPPKSKLTQKNLALEAEVSESTLIDLDPITGVRRYADVLKCLKELRRDNTKIIIAQDDKEQKIEELRAELRLVREDKYNQALEIDRLGILLLSKTEEVERLEEVERQNAQLREEIRKMNYQPPKRIK